MKIIADTIKIPWVFHSDGDLNLVFEDLLTLGMDGINPFEPPIMDIAAIKKKYGQKICLWGNIDLVYTLTMGTPEEVDEEVRQRIREIGPGGGYICASANSITPYCKKENIYAMLNAIKKYGAYPINC
jgi:uroporphyrinogen decarboxylase